LPAQLLPARFHALQPPPRFVRTFGVQQHHREQEVHGEQEEDEGVHTGIMPAAAAPFRARLRLRRFAPLRSQVGAGASRDSVQLATLGGSGEWLDGPEAPIGSATLAGLSVFYTARIRSLTGL